MDLLFFLQTGRKISKQIVSENFVKIGFIEQRGRPKNIEYKWTGLYTRKRELFININQGGYQSGGKPQPVL